MTEYKALFIMDLNPEPWTVGTLSMGYKGKSRYPMMSKDQMLRDYQEGVAESIREAYPNLEMYPENVDLHLICKFWRREDEYTSGTGRKSSRNVADATNLTKALEDALQGILYKNDQQVKHSEGEIIMEGPDVLPRILVMCCERARYPEWQEIANRFELERNKPLPPGNVYYTRYMT